MIYGIYKYNEIFMYNVVGGMIELYPGGKQVQSPCHTVE